MKMLQLHEIWQAVQFFKSQVCKIKCDKPEMIAALLKLVYTLNLQNAWHINSQIQKITKFYMD